MKVIVQKFGGTSVRDQHGRQNALKHIKEVITDGYKSIVVVSAMGRKGEPYATDTLLQLIGVPNSHVSKREIDLLMSCGENISAVVFSNLLNQHGLKATALTGFQAGLVTTDDFMNAKVIEVNTKRIIKEFEEYDVIVVTGFQGATRSGDTTTLGRGGSDTSASVLGAAVKADIIDIFTDVEGIMTADPRLVENAKILETVTYEEICNMAHQGAKVIHPRAVEIAENSDIPIRVRSTYSDSEGTLITSKEKTKQLMPIKDRLVTGIAHVSNVTQIKVFANNGPFDLNTQVFKAMANEEISVDFINIYPNGVVYTISDEVSDKAVKVLNNLNYEPVVTKGCAKVSIVGAGITGVPGVTSKIVTALSENGVSILQSADSHTTIWVLVNGEDLGKAVNALHNVFNLSKIISVKE
ncbi:MAG: aspartate kinase, monofunctional class [Bacillales bacterium]|jgi:aspartate kinase|nr:aspartate kinase, monofunctional class [Bacillales bacterium]